MAWSEVCNEFLSEAERDELIKIEQKKNGWIVDDVDEFGGR
jgi:hypothetical protein